MRILVTGATGFIGRPLVAALKQRGDDVVTVSRRQAVGVVPWHAVAEHVEGAGAIVHLAGEPVADARWTPARLALIRSSRIETTSALAQAVARAARKPRVFISGSAVGYYGMLGGDAQPVGEDGPPGNDVLARIVVDWEKAADAARTAGVRTVHPRTGVVLGRGGGAFEKMAAPYRWFAGGPIGGGDQWVSWVHIADVVRALLFLIDGENLQGPFNVVSPHPCTMNELAQAIGRALDRPAFFRVPPIALRLALGQGRAEMLLSGQRALPRKLLDAGFVFEFPRVEPAVADLR